MTTGNIVVATASQNPATPVGSLLFSAREIVEMSLQDIGAFSPNDEGADPEEMDRGLKRLELIVAEVAGTEDCWWLMPESVSFMLPANERVSTLEDLMGANYPSTGVLFPISAVLTDADGQRVSDLELVRRWQYEEISNKNDTGQPELLYIDRLAAAVNVFVYRVPTTDEYYVDMVVQTYHRSVIGAQGQSEQAGSLPHGFSAEWQLYLVNRLNTVIGAGPVRRCTAADITRWREAAETSFGKLVHSNREKRSEPSRTAPWGRD